MSGQPESTLEELRKLHIHTCHSPLEVMSNMIRLAGRQFDRAILGNLIRNCACDSIRRKIGTSLVRTNFAPYPGHSIIVDISYLRGGSRHDFTYLVIIDSFSRFLATVELRTIQPATVIRAVETSLVAYFGKPRTILKDGGPGKVGRPWPEFSSAMDITSITSPKSPPNQTGGVERHIGMLKSGIIKLLSFNPDGLYGEMVRGATLAHNHTPLLGLVYHPCKSCVGGMTSFRR